MLKVERNSEPIWPLIPIILFLKILSLSEVELNVPTVRLGAWTLGSWCSDNFWRHLSYWYVNILGVIVLCQPLYYAGCIDGIIVPVLEWGDRHTNEQFKCIETRLQKETHMRMWRDFLGEVTFEVNLGEWVKFCQVDEAEKVFSPKRQEWACPWEWKVRHNQSREASWREGTYMWQF